MAGSAPPRQIPRSARNDSNQRRPDDAQPRPADGDVKAVRMGAERGRIVVIPRSEATRNLGWAGCAYLLPARFLPWLGMTARGAVQTKRMSNGGRLTGV